MASASPRSRALVAGLTAGALASAAAVLPLVLAGGATRAPEYVALLVVVLGTHVGSRQAVAGLPAPPFPVRLRAMTTTALAASALLGVALWLLYATWRPDLLDVRYRALIVDRASTAALADLVARRAQSVDPLFQALSVAGTGFFLAFLTGGFAAYRRRVASRMAASRPRAND
jgi:hypothetical protein